MRRIARAGIEQFAVFAAAAGRSPAPPRRRRPDAGAAELAPSLGWLDDWTPEAAGIFRIFRREADARSAEIAADAGRGLAGRRRPAAARPAGAGRRRLQARRSPSRRTSE